MNFLNKSCFSSNWINVILKDYRENYLGISLSTFQTCLNQQQVKKNFNSTLSFHFFSFLSGYPWGKTQILSLIANKLSRGLTCMQIFLKVVSLDWEHALNPIPSNKSMLNSIATQTIQLFKYSMKKDHFRVSIMKHPNKMLDFCLYFLLSIFFH